MQPKRINDHDSNYQGIDLWAWDHPNKFPIGSYSYTIETDGKPPPINWAKENIKTRTRPYKWKCLGIFICPTEGCSYRARPQCPRRGKDKFCTTDNKKPTLKVKQQCSTHPTSEMTYQKCRAYWYMIPDGRKKVWTVHHVGVHEHQAPPAISAGGNARELIRKYLSVDPKMTVTELLMGNDIRPSIGEANIRFYNPNYLKHILREERKKSTIDMQEIQRLLIRWTRYLNSTGSYWIRTKTLCAATFIKARSVPSLQSTSNLPSWKSLVVTP